MGTADGRRHRHGGAVSAERGAIRRLLHAEHADGCALRGAVAGIEFHPRGLGETLGRVGKRHQCSRSLIGTWRRYRAVAATSVVGGKVELPCAPVGRV